jgi:Flp pilus assembly CpaE family ATPase
VSDDDRPRLLLGLTPLAERQVEEQLFGDEHAVAVAGSAADAAQLHALAERNDADAVLLSPELPGLDAPLCARLRSYGLRLLGLAFDDRSADTLVALGIDATLRVPLTPRELAAACADVPSLEVPAPTTRPRREQTASVRAGSVLAVVPAGGSPGGSEVAASLAALADRRWPTLLLELDLVDGALALRLGADPQHGSLLGLARAREADGSLDDLLQRWTAAGEHDWPHVLVAPPDVEAHIDELAQPGVIRAALDAAASVYPLVVADVGALLSLPGELPKVLRVHREALLAADAVLLVIGAREQQLRAGRAQLTLLLDELGIPRDRLRIAIAGLAGAGVSGKRELEQAVADELAELRLAVDAWLPYDARAAKRARRTGAPLALARSRSRYTRALSSLMEQLFLPSQPVPRERKLRLPISLPTGAPMKTATPPTTTTDVDEEVALPWRS